jgi:hypothetical protein
MYTSLLSDDSGFVECDYCNQRAAFQLFKIQVRYKCSSKGCVNFLLHPIRDVKASWVQAKSPEYVAVFSRTMNEAFCKKTHQALCQLCHRQTVFEYFDARIIAVYTCKPLRHTTKKMFAIHDAGKLATANVQSHKPPASAPILRVPPVGVNPPQQPSSTPLGATRWRCRICHQSFPDDENASDYWFAHWRGNHVTSQEYDSTSPKRCCIEGCDWYTITKMGRFDFQFKKHILNEHLRALQFKCHIHLCQSTFDSSKDLRRHIRTVHPNAPQVPPRLSQSPVPPGSLPARDPVSCSICKMHMADDSQLEMHMMYNHHPAYQNPVNAGSSSPKRAKADEGYTVNCEICGTAYQPTCASAKNLCDVCEILCSL